MSGESPSPTEINGNGSASSPYCPPVSMCFSYMGVTVESMAGTNAVRDPQTVALNAWGRYASGERLHGSAEHINLSRCGSRAF